MSKKEEEIILEQKPIINGNMTELLEKVVNFNNDYLSFLKNELEKAKEEQEMRNNG
jgi:hypothetical protein